MKREDIRVGGYYAAKVNGKIVTVRVIDIRQSVGYKKARTVYDVVNTETNKATTFKSAAKFRNVAELKKDAQQSWKAGQTTPEDEQRDLDKIDEAVRRITGLSVGPNGGLTHQEVAVTLSSPHPAGKTTMTVENHTKTLTPDEVNTVLYGTDDESRPPSEEMVQRLTTAITDGSWRAPGVDVEEGQHTRMERLAKEEVQPTFNVVVRCNSPEDAERLFWAAYSGELAEFGVISAEYKETSEESDHTASTAGESTHVGAMKMSSDVKRTPDEKLDMVRRQYGG